MMKISLPEISIWSTPRIILATLIVLSIGSGFWLLYQVRWVIFMFFVALIIGIALTPLVDRLHRLGLPRPLGAGLVYTLLVVLLTGFAILLVPLLIEQVVMIISKIPSYYDQLRGTLINSPNLMLQQLSWRLPPELPTTTFLQSTTQNIEGAGVESQSSADLLVKGTFLFIATLLLSFYWILDGQRAFQILLLLTPAQRRDYIRELINAIEIKVGAYIRGQIVLCGSVGLLTLAAYLLIGVPNALVLALFAGLMEIVPVIGPVLGAIPAIIITAAIGSNEVIWVILATLTIQQLENSWLLPRIMDKAVGVNPIVTLLAFFTLGSVLGVLGAILAVPIAAIVQLLLDRYIFEPPSPKELISAGRDQFSLLRYEAQELAQDIRRQVLTSPIVYAEGSQHLEEEIEAMVADLDNILAQIKSSGGVA